MLYAIRYYKECLEEVDAQTLMEAEQRARLLAAAQKWTLLSVSPADDPRPMPSVGLWDSLITWDLPE